MADTEIEHAERIVALEVQMLALTKSVDTLSSKVDELLGIVQQARGARYALVGLGAIGGALVSSMTGLAGKLGVVFGLVAK